MPNTVPATATGLPSFLRPEEYPDIYAADCAGVCLEPLIMDGTKLLFSRHEPFQPGDLVGLLLHPDKMAAYGHPMIVKRLVLGISPDFWKPWRKSSAILPMVVVEMLNPRTTLAFRPGELLGIHKCLGPVPEGVKTYKVTNDEIRAAAHARAVAK